jgi:hypothetical protein
MAQRIRKQLWNHIFPSFDLQFEHCAADVVGDGVINEEVTMSDKIYQLYYSRTSVYK